MTRLALPIAASFRAVLTREVIRTLVFRLIMLAMFFGALVFTCALHEGAPDKRFGLWWLLVALVVFAILWLLSRQPTPERAYVWALAAYLGIGAWWVILLMYSSVSSAVGIALLWVLIIGSGFIPWTLRSNIAWASIAIVCALFSIGTLPFSLLTLAITMAFVAIGARLSAEQRLDLMTSTSSSSLGHYCDSPSTEALFTLRLLTAQTAALVDCARGLIVFGTQQAEVIGAGEIKPSQLDPVFFHGLQQAVLDTGADQGILFSRSLGTQFEAPLRDWFGAVPRRLFFVRFVAVVGQSEQRVIVCTPLKASATLTGRGRTFRALMNLAAIARISLSASRGRFLSSDVLLVSQKSISEREEELNQLVHLVNNVAQDMAIQCEELRHFILHNENETNAQAKLLTQVQDIEGVSRSLSVGVSDVKLFQELIHLRSFNRSEMVSVASIVDEVNLYATYRARRRGDGFECANLTKPETQVKVISREFLETVLRALIREASVPPAGMREGKVRCRLSVSMKADTLTFEVEGSGISLEGFAEFRMNNAPQNDISVDRRERVLRAVQQFASLSGGGFEIQLATQASTATFSLTLPGSLETPVHKVSVSGQWALFVDDNPQVTSFYGKVAQALGVNFQNAASVEEANSIIRERGKPHLVITDIQLGEGSGLDLVRTLRGSFGSALPIIVVSGNPEENIKMQVAEAGGSKFLAKPIGRARLFGEIEQLLGRAGDLKGKI